MSWKKVTRTSIKIGDAEAFEFETHESSDDGTPDSSLVADRDRAMLRYVVKLTNDPGSMRESDVERLRTAGFDDRGIHDICAITAYFAFVNRIADGLGVPLES